MGERSASGGSSGKPTPRGSGKGAPLKRSGFSLPADLDYKLRVAVARRGVKEVHIVREAVAKYLGHDLGPEPREPVLLSPVLVDALSQLAASRGVSPDELAADLLVEALDRSEEEG